jgi:alpha-mannosidase
MKSAAPISRWSQIASLVTLFCVVETACSAPGIPQTKSFPDSLQSTVQPYYRHRPDGKPGREVGLTFKGSKLYGPALLEILADTHREILQLPSTAHGLDSIAVLLPPDIGVERDAQIRIVLRQGKNTLEERIQVPAMRHWTVFVYPHSHVDVGYSNTHANVEFIHKRNIDQGIKLAESTRHYPDGARYLWNTEVMWPFERYYSSAKPEQKDRLIKAVQRGELCPDAAYVHVLTTSCSDEEMIQLLRPRREAAKLTGEPLDAYVQVDIPGMAWGLVPVLAHEGVRYVMMMPNGTRGNDSLVSSFRQKPFWWEGQDGKSRVLFLNAGGYGAGMEKGGKTGRPWFGQRDREKIPEVIRTKNPRADFLDHHLFRELPLLEKARHPYEFYVVTWAMWDNALLDADLPEAVKSWNKEYAFPHLEISSAHKIMQSFEKRYGNQLPVIRGDFTEYWTDGVGTVARETRMNRNAKDRLVQAETLWPMLHQGMRAPRAELDEAWRYIVLCTEHTFTYENPAEPYFQDAIWRMKQHYFQEAEDRSRLLLDDALAPATDKSNGALGPLAGPSNGGVAVINTNSWQHGGLVTLSYAESQIGDRVLDDDGHEVISQRLSTGELVFTCPDIPAFGSRHFRVVAGSCSLTSSCRFTETLLDNGNLQVELDRATGNILRLEEKGTGKNFADARVNGGLNAFRWQPARGIGNAQADTVCSIILKESGPLLGEVQVASKAPGCRSLTRSVRLVYGQPCVEITNVVDKLPLLAKDGIHFGFGFNVPRARTRVDIPWGVIELEKDQWPAANRAWTAAQHFVDISNDTLGVTVCSLDAPLVESGSMTGNNTAGWDGKGDMWPSQLPPSSIIYSWVMNNHWFTNTPLTQDGPVTFRYALLPHGKYDAAKADRFGLEHTQPLIALAASKNPITTPLAAITNDRVAVTTLKTVADGRAMIVRLRSFSERDESVRLTWPARAPQSVRICDRGEEPGKAQASGEVTVPAMGYVTLRVEW